MNLPAVPDIRAEDVPRQWREIVRYIKHALWIFGVGGLAVALVHVEAARVVSAAWTEKQRAEVVAIATEAAKQGARDAMLEGMQTLVRPLQDRLQAVALETKESGQRLTDLRERVQRVEDRLDALPAERRRLRVTGNP